MREDERAAIILANLKPEAVAAIASGLGAIRTGHIVTLKEAQLLRAISAVNDDSGPYSGRSRTLLGRALSRVLGSKGLP